VKKFMCQLWPPNSHDLRPVDRLSHLERYWNRRCIASASWRQSPTIRYDTIEEFNVDSKAE